MQKVIHFLDNISPGMVIENDLAIKGGKRLYSAEPGFHNPGRKMGQHILCCRAAGPIGKLL